MTDTDDLIDPDDLHYDPNRVNELIEEYGAADNDNMREVARRRIHYETLSVPGFTVFTDDGTPYGELSVDELVELHKQIEDKHRQMVIRRLVMQRPLSSD